MHYTYFQANFVINLTILNISNFYRAKILHEVGAMID